LGNGTGGTATASSQASDAGMSVSSDAVAAVKGSTVSQASAGFGASNQFSWPSLSSGSNGVQAFSYALAMPGAAALGSALAGAPRVSAGLGGRTVLGLGVLGANYGSAASGNRTYTASTSYNFSLASQSNLSVGLLGMSSYGGGFNSLNFSVKSGATTLLSASFTSLSAAQTYFTDQSLSLGSFAAGATSLVVSYSLTASAAKGADISYLLSSQAVAPGASALGSGGAATQAAVRGSKFNPRLNVARMAPTLVGMTSLGSVHADANGNTHAVAGEPGRRMAMPVTRFGALLGRSAARQ
jgi:hypothetical protein